MIYLDYNATTPLCAAAREAIQPFLKEYFGNPSSVHAAGREARAAVDDARDRVAALLGAKPHEIIFTSGGTESNNLAVLGLARRHASRGKHLISNRAEHHAVLHAIERLEEREGFEVTWLDLSSDGLVDPDQLAGAIRPDTILVSIMSANNETGVIQPIHEIATRCRARGVLLHSDMVQAFGKLEGHVSACLCDAASFAAHKFYGPKGAGFLYLRSGTPFWATLTGGSHENNRRAGTENVPLIVGMSKALELVEAERDVESARLRGLRDQLIGGILETVEGAGVTGARTQRLAGHASFVIDGVEAEGILIALDLAGIAASSGSACTSGRNAPSHVLTAMGVPAEIAQSALRLTLGDDNTMEEVRRVAEKVPQVVNRLRAFA